MVGAKPTRSPAARQARTWARRAWTVRTMGGEGWDIGWSEAPRRSAAYG